MYISTILAPFIYRAILDFDHHVDAKDIADMESVITNTKQFCISQSTDEQRSIANWPTSTGDGQSGTLPIYKRY